MLDSSRY